MWRETVFIPEAWLLTWLYPGCPWRIWKESQETWGWAASGGMVCSFILTSARFVTGNLPDEPTDP